jgi:hypothetical protein
MENINEPQHVPVTEPDGTGNEITLLGKWIAGVLLVTATVIVLLLIIALWPDRLPVSGDKIARYDNKLFNIRLLDTSTVSYYYKRKHILKSDTTESNNLNTTAPVNSNKLNKMTADSPATNKEEDTSAGKTDYKNEKIDVKNTISINTLLLFLVAAAGFLGNMLHLATSFTTFVGSNKFKRNWILWYCVKPFTASGLAVVLYFSFRAGFLNSSDDASNLNLFGIVTLAALAGLFTDSATQKLKEVFDVMFKPGDERPNKL